MYHKTPEAIKKMEHYCAYEHLYHKHISQKINTMKLTTEAKEKIILYLLEHNFLIDGSFARGKFTIFSSVKFSLNDSRSTSFNNSII
ncbi:hypothetical protein [Aquimarina sp. LLG6339-5]|uniref:hypothetical protein n=1 Tax=Aquimarina sp. LLG6339-5 TaxID=3160830 RepID=UPI00386E8B89